MFGRHQPIALAGAYVVIVGLVMIVLHAPGVLAGGVLVVPLVIFGLIVAALRLRLSLQIDRRDGTKGGRDGCW